MQGKALAVIIAPSFFENPELIMIRALFGLALAFASLVATAQTPGTAQPGMWEYQMETIMTGMPMKMPPTTIRRCLTPQDVSQNKHLVQENQKNPCTMSNMKVSGGQISYDFVCKTDGGTMKGSTSGSVSSTAMDLQTRMQMIPPMEGMSEMQQKMKARRVGNC